MKFKDFIPEPFSFNYKDTIYKIEYFKNENEKGEFFLLTNVLTGKEKIVLVINYGKGSGNEHLLNTLEHKTTVEYMIKSINKFFAEMRMKGLEMP